MAFVMSKVFHGRYTYYYLVEGRREGPRTSQKHIAYMGRTANIDVAYADALRKGRTATADKLRPYCSPA